MRLLSVPILLALLLVCACTPPQRARPLEPLSRNEAPSSSQGITLLAGSPQTVGGKSAVLVTVINRGRRPLHLERGQFVLAPQLASGHAAAEVMISARDPAGEQRAQALPEGTLAPGETARGYLYFRDVPGDGAQVQARLIAADTREVVDILAAPLASPR